MQNRHFLLQRLELAIKNNSLESVVSDLKQIGENPTSINLDNETFLYLAMEHNATAVIPYLLDYLTRKAKLKSILHSENEMTDDQDDSNEKLNENRTEIKSIFWHAAKHGNAEAFAEMLALYEDSKSFEIHPGDSLWKMPDELGDTPLHLACKKGNLKIVSLIVEQAEAEEDNTKEKKEKEKGKEKEKSNPSRKNEVAKILNAYNLACETPLYLAMQTQKLVVIDYLIKKGAKIDVENYESKRPLQLLSNDLESLLQLENMGLNEKISHMEREILDDPGNKTFKKNYFQLSSRHSLLQLVIANLRHNPACKQRNYYDARLISPSKNDPAYQLSLTERYLPVPESLLALIIGTNDLFAPNLEWIEHGREFLDEIEIDEETAGAENIAIFQNIKDLNHMAKRIKNHIQDLRKRENPTSVLRVRFDYSFAALSALTYFAVLAYAIYFTVIFTREEDEKADSCFKSHNTTKYYSSKDIYHACHSGNDLMLFFPILHGFFGGAVLAGLVAYFYLKDRSKSIYRNEWENLEQNIDLFTKGLKSVDKKEDEDLTNQIAWEKLEHIENLEKISSQLKSSSIQLNTLIPLLEKLDDLISKLKTEIVKNRKPVIVSLFFLPDKFAKPSKASAEELSGSEDDAGYDDENENSTLLTVIASGPSKHSQ